MVKKSLREPRVVPPPFKSYNTVLNILMRANIARPTNTTAMTILCVQVNMFSYFKKRAGLRFGQYIYICYIPDYRVT